jgi:hypothetical protein
VHVREHIGPGERRRQQPVVADRRILEQQGVAVERDVLITRRLVGILDEEREAGIAVRSAGARGGSGQG